MLPDLYGRLMTSQELRGQTSSLTNGREIHCEGRDGKMNTFDRMRTTRKAVISLGRVTAVALALTACLAAPLWADDFPLQETNPIVLPSGQYFFRPEVLLTSGDFRYLSSLRPNPGGTALKPYLQAWIRNSRLAPDWLRIGTDIIGGAFNMAFSLTGATVPDVGTPSQTNCHGQSLSALSRQFGGVDASASGLGFSNVQALQDAFALF